jgi:hypothetical protein
VASFISSMSAVPGGYFYPSLRGKGLSLHSRVKQKYRYKCMFNNSSPFFLVYIAVSCCTCPSPHFVPAPGHPALSLLLDRHLFPAPRQAPCSWTHLWCCLPASFTLAWHPWHHLPPLPPKCRPMDHMTVLPKDPAGPPLLGGSHPLPLPPCTHTTLCCKTIRKCQRS